ncbi:MAG: hypothetical protein A2V64_13560 [Bacteroidetes bacterium RBG_13_43_22]|nr:MAG: hypothetical protein A2V64_13560 [Bacteroidetes bacterium RBG_13_43_22]
MPTFIGGFNANLSFKQFDMSLLFQGAAGAIQYLGMESGEIGNFYQYFAEDRWTPENTATDLPRSWNRDNEYWRANGNTFWNFSTDYLRLKSMEIGYTLPESVNNKLNIKKFRIYISGQNLLTLSKIKIIDPEVQGGTSYVPQRVINTGITLTF